MYRLSARSIARREGVDPRLIAVCDRALEISLIDFGIPADGGLRTEGRQRELFDGGLSLCDGIIERSKHQDGKALDFFAFVDGRASWDALHLTHVAAAFLQAAAELGIKIKWGGFFGRDGWDKPHIEIDE